MNTKCSTVAAWSPEENSDPVRWNTMPKSRRTTESALSPTVAPKRQCRAYPHSPHLATHRNGFCDKHYDEYEAAMRRYRSAVYNFKTGRTSKKPPSKQEFVRTIRFSDPNTNWRKVRPADREEMLAVMTALHRDMAFLSRLMEDQQAFLDMTWTEWQSDIAALLRSVNRASAIVLQIANGTPVSTGRPGRASLPSA